MERFCPGCGTQRADGAGFCSRCGHRFDAGVPEAAAGPGPAAPAVDQAAPPPLEQQARPAEPLSAPPKRPLTFGQKIVLGLFVIGFLLVSFVVTELQVRARHPHYYYH